MSEQLRDALIAPKAVTIIGASDEPEKTAGRPLAFLRRHGFSGRVYPINARRATVLGERAYPDIGAVPDRVDHAFIALPTEPAMAAARACANAGVRLVTMLADGFAESGPAGVERQRQLQALSRQTGCRILGPNSLGMVRTLNGLSLTANAAFAVDRLVRGRTAVLSQSGSLIGTFYSRGRKRGIGFSTLISVGNEADLSIGELGEALVTDAETDAFVLFLETIRYREQLERFARAADEAGKPILAYKLGRSAAGAELAVSHTGALVGSDAAADQLLHELGIMRFHVFEALFEAIPLGALARQRSTPGSGVTVVTTTGGGGAMVADQLGVHGVPIQEAPPSVFAELKAAGIELRPGALLDVTMAGTQATTMRAIVDALLKVRELGVLVFAVGSSAEFFPERAVSPIIDALAAQADDKPLVAVFAVPEAEKALEMLAAAGVPAFRTPESCADAIRAVLAREPLPPRPSVVLSDATRVRLDRAEETLNEWEALAIFADLGIRTPQQSVITPEQIEAMDAASLPPFPLVAKLLSRDLPHKSESGGVTLGIASLPDLSSAAAAMIALARAHAPEARIEGILVQEQCASLAEVLVGLGKGTA